MFLGDLCGRVFEPAREVAGGKGVRIALAVARTGWDREEQRVKRGVTLIPITLWSASVHDAALSWEPGQFVRIDGQMQRPWQRADTKPSQGFGFEFNFPRARAVTPEEVPDANNRFPSKKEMAELKAMLERGSKGRPPERTPVAAKSALDDRDGWEDKPQEDDLWA